MKDQLNLLKLNKVELQHVSGGCVWTLNNCGCACSWEHEGGSSSDANCTANDEGGKVSPNCQTPK